MIEGNLMSGLRLSSGGLHLGHYLGCLTPLDNLPVTQDLYFVIRDRGIIGEGSDTLQSNLDNILLDLASTKYSHRLKFILQSKIYEHFTPLLNYIQNIVSLNQLQNAHPQRHNIRRNISTLNVIDFLFPLESICTYYSLNAEKVLMNDDNLVTVKFGEAVCKKLHNRTGFSIFKSPQLIHGKIPRLLGYNYSKMSKGNNNAIFFSSSDQELAIHIQKLLSFKYLFRKFPELRKKRSKEKENFIIPDEYLPFDYLRILNHDSTVEEKINSLKNYSQFVKLASELEKTFFDFFYELRKKRNRLDLSMLKTKLITDTEEAEKMTVNLVETFLNTIDEPHFY